MENTDIQTLWAAYDKKLENLLRLNRQNTEEITRLRVRSFLASMQPSKIFALLAGLTWVIFADLIIIGSLHRAGIFFLVSAIIQVLLCKIAIGVYLYQLFLIRQIDISEPIFRTQHRLAFLQTSTLWGTRILFLQLPLWTTFYWSTDMFRHANPWLTALQVFITLLFCLAAAWLFRNIRYENRNKKWFRLLFEGKEWTPLLKAAEILEQTAAYDNNNTPDTGPESSL